MSRRTPNGNKGILSIVGVATLSLVSVAGAAQSSDPQLKKEAKITEARAKHTALSKVPGGTIKSAEIEREKGRLVWSFDIAKPNRRDITEILVDAKSGKIISTQTESPSDQAREAAADQRQRH